VGAVTPGTGPPRVSAEPLVGRLREVAAAALERERVPGCAIGLPAGGDAAFAALGVTSVEQPLPVDEQTLFQVGSITFAICANADSGHRVINETRRAFAEELGITGPPSVHYRAAEALRLAARVKAIVAEKLGEYVGRYTALGGDVELSVEGETLLARTTTRVLVPESKTVFADPPPTRYRLEARDRIVGIEGPGQDGRGDFIRGPDERITIALAVSMCMVSNRTFARPRARRTPARMRARREVAGGSSQMRRLRSCAEAKSMTATVSTIMKTMRPALRYSNRLIVWKSICPIPPPPTKPRIGASRTFASSR
jgi:hypothetical protein